MSKDHVTITWSGLSLTPEIEFLVAKPPMSHRKISQKFPNFYWTWYCYIEFHANFLNFCFLENSSIQGFGIIKQYIIGGEGAGSAPEVTHITRVNLEAFYKKYIQDSQTYGTYCLWETFFQPYEVILIEETALGSFRAIQDLSIRVRRCNFIRSVAHKVLQF